MNTRRLTMSLLIALGISGMCTYVLGRGMAGSSVQKKAAQNYVAPARALASGELLKPEDLRTISWPAAQPIVGAFEKSDALVGRIVLYPISPGQPFTDKMVSAAGAGTGLAARIPEGMRAIALKSDDVVGVAGFLAPGSHLDVLVTYRTDKQPEPTTLTVLQDAEVLAAGHQVQPDPEGKPSTVTVVTLLMSPGEAERVVLASTQGTIHFVLRSGSDKARLQENPITLSQLSPGASVPLAAHAAIGHLQAATLVANASQSIRVQTILGDKEVTSTFSKVDDR